MGNTWRLLKLFPTRNLTAMGLERFFRGAWRAWLRLRHRRALRGAGESGEPVIEEVAGFPVIVLPSVFNPTLLRSGAFLAESLNEELIPQGSRVLELGAGTAVGAIVASQWAAAVVATDINPEAIRGARINVMLNRVEERVIVREGDLFAPVDGERFDVVLFNPPYFRGEPRDARDRAWRSPDLDRRFASELSRHLEPGGAALLCLSTDGDLDFIGPLESGGYAIEVVAERDLLNEVLRLYRARPSPRS